jgi:hypothetical protein
MPPMAMKEANMSRNSLGDVRFWMNKTFSCLIVISLCGFWSACEIFYGPAYVEVSPEHPSIVVGATQQFKLRAFYLNPTYNEDKTGVTEWSTSNPAVATISKYGVATAIAPGEALITGRYQSDSDNTRLTVP